MSTATKILCIASGILTGLVLSEGQLMKNKINETKQKVAESDISAKNFQKLNNQIENRCGGELFTRNIEWQKALDSLNTEGLVKKAYLEGQQAVRDSITKAAKVRP